MKAREMMYRESLRISVTNLHEAMTPTEEKDRFKKVGIWDLLLLIFNTHYLVFFSSKRPRRSATGPSSSGSR